MTIKDYNRSHTSCTVFLLILLTILCCAFANSSLSALAAAAAAGENGPIKPVSIKYIRIYSKIELTHGITFIKMHLKNNDNVGRVNSVEFVLTLPPESFVKNFTIRTDNRTLGPKLELVNRLNSLPDVNLNSVIGSVEQVGRPTSSLQRIQRNEYLIKVHLQPAQSVVATLIYEEQVEQLARVNSLTYQYKLDLRSDMMDAVEDFKAIITIKEPNLIRNPIFPNIRTRTNSGMVCSLGTENLSIKNVSDSTNNNTIRISWFPDARETLQLVRDGCLGQFVLEYNIQTKDGEILVGNGYILREGVRYSEPSTPRRPTEAQSKLFKPEVNESQHKYHKHIIFVLDISGSMEGTKLSHLQSGMTQIINSLPSETYFSLVTFSNTVQVWQALTNSPPRPVPAITEFKTSAINFIKNLTVHGSTNIFDALVTALKISQQQRPHNNNNNNQTSLIFFLTDGEPTSGLVNRTEILRRIRKLNFHTQKSKKSLRGFGFSPTVTPIFTLAFGEEADSLLCEQISEQNQGFSRQIFENLHSPTHLYEFYTDIMRTFDRHGRRSGQTSFTYHTDTRGPLYYELEDQMFNILFKTTTDTDEYQSHAMTHDDNNPITLPMEDRSDGGGVMQIWHAIEWRDAVVAINVDANGGNGGGEKCTPKPGDDDAPVAVVSCPDQLNPGTLFRLKLFLKLQFQTELMKMKGSFQDICSLISSNGTTDTDTDNFVASGYGYESTSNDRDNGFDNDNDSDKGKNTSHNHNHTQLMRDLKYAMQLQIITPCTFLYVRDEEEPRSSVADDGVENELDFISPAALA